MRREITVVFVLMFVLVAQAAQSCEKYWGAAQGLSQEWPAADRNVWYSTSQGSRLVPMSWYQNLKIVGEDTLFSSRKNQEKYTSLFCDNSDFPLGFVTDNSATKGAALGLTCAACHTAILTDGTSEFVVEGGASDLDLQSYLEDLFAAVLSVFRDSGVEPGPVWDTFANGVLGDDHTAKQSVELQSELRDWLHRRHQIQQSIDDGGTWGHGRSDAVAVILNTATFLSGTRAGTKMPIASAPVSYPFVWNAPQLQRVQWNGSAVKIHDIGIVKSMELGALIRNVAEVLGVFAEINLTSDKVNDTSRYPGLQSSVRLDNLVRLERSIETLKSPKWPVVWGAVDTSGNAYLQGKDLYQKHCVACHSILDRDDLDTRIEDAVVGADVGVPVTRHVPVFTPIFSGGVALNTDPMMACNAMTHTSWTGKFQVLHNSFGALRKLSNTGELKALKLEKFDEGTATLRLVEELALRMIYEKRHELMALQEEDISDAAKGYFDGIIAGIFGRDPGRKINPADIGSVPIEGTHSLRSMDDVRRKCIALLAAQTPVVGDVLMPEYKARPLNGIFASAPFLHNGSVPTLDDLLKPAAHRPVKFSVGATLYDVEKLGNGAAIVGRASTVYRTQHADGRALVGNSNQGHEYPEVPLTATERAALLEYLKAL